MNEQFIRKVYRSVALTWVIAMTWAIALGKPWIALSITFGMALGTAVLASYEWVIRRAFVPGEPKAGRALLKLGFVKLPLVCALLYVLVRLENISLPAFCGGIILVHLAMFAKLVGIKLVERREAMDAIPSSDGGKES